MVFSHINPYIFVFFLSFSGCLPCVSCPSLDDSLPPSKDSPFCFLATQIPLPLSFLQGPPFPSYALLPRPPSHIHTQISVLHMRENMGHLAF